MTFVIQCSLLPSQCVEEMCIGAFMAVQIKEIKGMRCWVHGYVKDMSGALLASCLAQLVNLQQLWTAQGQSAPGQQ